MSKAPARLMISDAQQKTLWPMLAEAWLAHALETGERVNDSRAKELWRKRYLGARLGVWSLKQIPRAGRTFARVMGALQEVARNGIDWILKAEEGGGEALVHHARAVLAAWDISEGYACGIARNSFHLERVPAGLEELTPPQLDELVRLLHAQGPRVKASAAKAGAGGAGGEGDPF